MSDDFTLDKYTRMEKIVLENEQRRNTVMETSRIVNVPDPKDPAFKLKERLATYKNVRKMKTDYKNYVKKFGEPSFYVPEDLWRKISFVIRDE